MFNGIKDLLIKYNNKDTKLLNKLDTYTNFKQKKIPKNKITLKYKNKYIIKPIFFNYNFILIILLKLFISINAKEIKNRKLSTGIYQITIKVNGIGNQEIIYQSFNKMPDKIYSSSGEEISITNNLINIEENESTIILKWSEALKNCSWMFYNLENIIEVDLSNFDPANVKEMREMFSGCTNLEKITIGNNFNSLIVTDVYRMFYRCSSLKSLDLSGFDTSNVIKMNDMFYNCTSLISLDMSNFNTNSVEKMAKIFKNCESIISLNLFHFNTKKITNMDSMFEGCSSLIYLNISSFDTSSVISMNNMFKGCKNLLSIDVSNFNTSSLTIMRYMFANNEKLEFLDLSNFDVSNVNNMEKIFSNCISLTSIDIFSFNTSLCENFERMFYNCVSLTSLNLSNLDLSSATDITYMFAGCSNLNYINFKSFTEKEELDINNTFLDTPDNLIYCIEDISNMQKIISQLTNKICTFNDCENNWEENKENRFEEKKKDIQIFEDKCVYKDIEDISNNFILTDKIPETTIYSYDINSNMEELENKYTNLTLIEISEEQISYIRKYFNLDDNENIYFLVIDTVNNDSMTATSWYDYKLLFENGTILDLSNLDIDIEVNVLVPIRDLDLAKYETAEYFSNEGYDIYDMESDFYTDICASASINGNDITIKDRKQEIFPNNITLCKSSCEYKGVNLEDKRVICECKLVSNNNNSNSDDEDENLFKNYFIADDGNFATYLLDNINFKPFSCGHLLFSLDNLKYNYSLYIISLILVSIIALTIEFFSYKIIKIRSYLFKESPIEQKLRKSIKNKEKIIDLSKRKTSLKISLYKNNKDDIKRNSKTKNLLKLRKSHKLIIPNKINFSIKGFNKLKRKDSGSSKMISNSNSNINKEEEKVKKCNTEKNIENTKDKDKEKDKEDPNEMPFSKAIREDKRNILQVFKSILFSKINIINLFVGEEKVKELIICEFILSLLINFFFNALLYSDEIVSHKYHNNGNLDFIVTFSLSILSNIITSFVCFFLEYSPLIEDRLEQIVEIKYEYDYLKTLKKFLRNLKIKIIIFFFTEIIVIIICFYYIVIFTIIYNKSQLSLLINYLSSILEDLIKSLIVTTVIVLTRKIGIFCSNKYIYNTSKFINQKF